MQIIYQGNPQQVNVTEVSHNQVANVTIGAAGAKQQAPQAEEPEEAPCEIVPDPQEQQAEKDADSQASQKPTPSKAITRLNRLSPKEKQAINFLKQAGFLDKEYEFYTEDAAQNNSKLRYLTTAQRAMLAKTVATLCNPHQPCQQYIEKFCKDFWRMPANNHTLSTALSKYKDSTEGQAFQQELDQILLPMNKKAR